MSPLVALVTRSPQLVSGYYSRSIKSIELSIKFLRPEQSTKCTVIISDRSNLMPRKLVPPSSCDLKISDVPPTHVNLQAASQVDLRQPTLPSVCSMAKGRIITPAKYGVNSGILESQLTSFVVGASAVCNGQ